MTNEEIAKILQDIADYYAMDDVPFKPRAYEKAAGAIMSFDRQLAEVYKQDGVKGLLGVPGVGKGIALHLVEIFRTGKLKQYQQMKKKMPVNLHELRGVPGLGPKKIKALYRNLKIKNLKDLGAALGAHKISKLAGFGQKSEAEIAASLKFHARASARYLLGQVEALVADIQSWLQQSGLFNKLMVGGSYRRRQETIGDIDILGAAARPKKAMEFFVNLPLAAQILERGQTKSVIRLASGIQVDLRIIKEQSWGAALQYFTGDKTHNIKMRKIAIAKGLKLSEYGLFRGNSEKRIANSETEEEVYKALGMDWIPPEIRTDTGEIEAAQKHQLPKLLDYGTVKGDLQVQTNWTDGQNSIEEMARAAAALGREYIAITDHTKSLAVTGGLDEKKLLRQMKVIDKINATLRLRSGQNSFRILKGAEVNLLKDGRLDIEDEVLAKLDVVGIAVHSHFKISRAEMTGRLVRAMANPNVDILFHLTTRIIQRREPIDFDFAAILRAAKKFRVALEIDAYPDRLDIRDTMVRQAVDAGVKLVIDTDAHNPRHLDFLHFGEAQARRGWAAKADVLNTRPVDKLLEYFNK